MKNKILIIIKIALFLFLSFLWFLFIQGEYEMITKPYLQNDFPIIKGIGAVYFLGTVILIISFLILFLMHSIYVFFKNRNSKKNIDL